MRRVPLWFTFILLLLGFVGSTVGDSFPEKSSSIWGELVIALNVGSEETFENFQRDNLAWLRTSNAKSFSSNSAVVNSSADPVFQTWRELGFGSIRYVIPVDPGFFDILFLFADFNASGYQRWGRRMVIVVNGVVKPLDLFIASGRANTPTAVTLAAMGINAEEGFNAGKIKIVIKNHSRSFLGPIINGIAIHRQPMGITFPSENPPPFDSMTISPSQGSPLAPSLPPLTTSWTLSPSPTVESSYYSPLFSTSPTPMPSIYPGPSMSFSSTPVLSLSIPPTPSLTDSQFPSLSLTPTPIPSPTVSASITMSPSEYPFTILPNLTSTVSASPSDASPSSTTSTVSASPNDASPFSTETTVLSPTASLPSTTATSLPLPTVSPISPQWSISSSLAGTARYESCSVEIRGRILHLFGRNRTPMNVSVYNPVDDTWTELARTPFTAHHLQCAVYQDQVIIGGAFGRGAFPLEKPLDDVYLFKPETGNWNKVTTMPQGRSRGSCALAVYQDKWYFAGGSLLGHGQGENFTVTFFDQFDPVSGIWTVMPDLPTRRDHGGASVVSDKLFLLGGQIGGAKEFWIRHVMQIDVFDFLTESWSTIGSTRYPHGGVSPAAVGMTIAIAGGEYNNVSSGATELLDVSTMALVPLELDLANPGGRHGFQLSSCGGSFFAGQGAISRKPQDIRLTTIERLDWLEPESPPCERHFICF